MSKRRDGTKVAYDTHVDVLRSSNVMVAALRINKRFVSVNRGEAIMTGDDNDVIGANLQQAQPGDRIEIGLASDHEWTFYGHAICHPHDQFDAHIGADLALSRALHRAAKAFRKENNVAVAEADRLAKIEKDRKKQEQADAEYFLAAAGVTGAEAGKAMHDLIEATFGSDEWAKQEKERVRKAILKLRSDFNKHMDEMLRWDDHAGETKRADIAAETVLWPEGSSVSDEDMNRARAELEEKGYRNVPVHLVVHQLAKQGCYLVSPRRSRATASESRDREGAQA